MKLTISLLVFLMFAFAIAACQTERIVEVPVEVIKEVPVEVVKEVEVVREVVVEKEVLIEVPPEPPTAPLDVASAFLSELNAYNVGPRAGPVRRGRSSDPRTHQRLHRQ